MSSRSDKKTPKGKDTGFACQECGGKEIVQNLREEQAKAIADEDYERAARLRDEIAHYESDDGLEGA